MTEDRKTGTIVAFPDGSTATSEKRPGGTARATAKAFDSLIAAQQPQLAYWLPYPDGPSIAPIILKLAVGETANLSAAGARRYAELYLALQGMAVPLGMSRAMDDRQRAVWLRALAEHATNRWGGNEWGEEIIATAQPLAWARAEAATKAWSEDPEEE